MKRCPYDMGSTFEVSVTASGDDFSQPMEEPAGIRRPRRQKMIGEVVNLRYHRTQLRSACRQPLKATIAARCYLPQRTGS
jgi:hypothetical protein